MKPQHDPRPSVADAAPHDSEPSRAQGIVAATDAVETHLRLEGYRGWDPYDALRSPLFGFPGLRARAVRIAAQQALRRLPFNVRPLLGIRQGLNPVTLGLCVDAYAHLAVACPDEVERWRARAAECVERLADVVSPGWSGACWGYDFDWETRVISFPAGTPTIVATGFVTNGLFAAHELLGLDGALELCKSACDFVLYDLNRTESTDGFCWSYSPLDRQSVLNATMKGARLCAQVGAADRQPGLLEQALETTRFTLERQRPDGSWPYSASDARTWTDNFHTGYVLDCLDEVVERSGDDSARSAIERGYAYYRAHFFVDGRIPRYYDRRTYPIDTSAAGQSILTLLRFGDRETAARVARWTVNRMQRHDGAFAYRRGRLVTNRIPYARWSSAWMLCALARLLAHT